MKKYLKVIVIISCFFTLTNSFGQVGLDDSQMREKAAARIKENHGIDIDWQSTPLLEITDIEARINSSARIKKNHGVFFDWHKTSLLELNDAEARLNTVQRIKKNYGVTFDWEKVSLQELNDAEARMNTAKRISITMKKPIDWKEHSLEDLLRMESGIAGIDPNLGESVLSFDVLFPPANQRAMGIHKLNQEEKKELQKHVESLLIAASQVGAQQLVPQITAQKQLSAPTQQGLAIESQIAGEFKGWEGETIVKLINGQIWQQAEYHYTYHYAYMPDVVIYNTSGGWKMKVEGVDKAVGVVRLK